MPLPTREHGVYDVESGSLSETNIIPITKSDVISHKAAQHRIKHTISDNL